MQQLRRETACPYPQQAVQEARDGRFQDPIPLHSFHANPSAYQAKSVRTILLIARTILLPPGSRSGRHAELGLEGPGEIREVVESDGVSHFLGECARMGAAFASPLYPVAQQMLAEADALLLPKDAAPRP